MFYYIRNITVAILAQELDACAAIVHSVMDPDESEKIAKDLEQEVPEIFPSLSPADKDSMVGLVSQWRKLGKKGSIPEAHAYWVMIYMVACNMMTLFGGDRISRYENYFTDQPVFQEFLRGWQKIACMSDVASLHCKGSQAFLTPKGKTDAARLGNQQKFLRELGTVIMEPKA